MGSDGRGTALVGVTQGGGAADPGPLDLSKRGLRPTGTTYENFLFNISTKGVSNFDLYFREIKNK